MLAIAACLGAQLEGAQPPAADVASAGGLARSGVDDARVSVGILTGFVLGLLRHLAGERLGPSPLHLLLDLLLGSAPGRLDPVVCLSLKLHRLLAQGRLRLGTGAGLRLARNAVGEPADPVLGFATGLVGGIPDLAL